MSEKDSFWSMKLDWLNILNSLKLDSINQIPEFKREKAVRRVTKTYDIDTLMELDPIELDKLVVHELRELMRKELGINARKKEQLEQEMQSKFVPFSNGGVFKINPQDFKDLDIDPENADPEEILKQIAKKLMKDDDDDSDDEKKYKEDNTGYYI